MSVRKNFMPLSLAYKERAAFTDELLLAAIPAGPDAHQYLLLDRATGNGRLLLERRARSRAERRLWDALAAEHGDLLKRPVSITKEDWPLIEYQWGQFFVIREARAKAAAAQRAASE